MALPELTAIQEKAKDVYKQIAPTGSLQRRLIDYAGKCAPFAVLLGIATLPGCGPQATNPVSPENTLPQPDRAAIAMTGTASAAAEVNMSATVAAAVEETVAANGGAGQTGDTLPNRTPTQKPTQPIPATGTPTPEAPKPKTTEEPTPTAATEPTATQTETPTHEATETPEELPDFVAAIDEKGITYYTNNGTQSMTIKNPDPNNPNGVIRITIDGGETTGDLNTFTAIRPWISKDGTDKRLYVFGRLGDILGQIFHLSNTDGTVNLSGEKDFIKFDPANPNISDLLTETGAVTVIQEGKNLFLVPFKQDSQKPIKNGKRLLMFIDENGTIQYKPLETNASRIIHNQDTGKTYVQYGGNGSRRPGYRILS